MTRIMQKFAIAVAALALVLALASFANAMVRVSLGFNL